jgi:hypothetical protein
MNKCDDDDDDTSVTRESFASVCIAKGIVPPPLNMLHKETEKLICEALTNERGDLLTLEEDSFSPVDGLGGGEQPSGEPL